MKRTAKKARQVEPKWPVCVVTREGKTTIRQFEGRRFVRLGEVRGKKVAWVEFYTCAPNWHSLSVHFQDRTVLYLEITPLFTVKPKYCSLKTGDLETIKEWPELRIER